MCHWTYGEDSAATSHINMNLYAYILGMRITGRTIPADILPTSENTYMVLNFPESLKVVLI